jgi:hypothetical protein
MQKPTVHRPVNGGDTRMSLNACEHRPQVIVTVAHFDTEVVHAHSAPGWNRRRVLAYFNQQQVMVNMTGAKQDRRKLRRYLTDRPSEDVGVKRHRSLQVADVEHEMPELLRRAPDRRVS